MKNCLKRSAKSANYFYCQIAITFCLLVVCSVLPAFAQNPAPSNASTDLFETKIRPLLLASCVGCHNKDNAGGGLRLDARISPDKAQEMLKRVNGLGGKPRMPLGSTLAKDKIALLESWVRSGAVWPTTSTPTESSVMAKGRSHWSFQPVKHPQVPHAKSAAWVINPVDAFIASGLERKGLHPNISASRQELIRRVTYDITGLPPTPEEVSAFEADRSPNAYSALVDRLLASPHYGEKWGRHWLDLVRYAETNSYERDNPKPNVYKYRDYVIRAFNEDKPYNQFVREQIAGDEIDGGAGDGLVATGYYRLGIWDDEPADMKQAQFDDLDDLVVTTGQTFLGLTLDCARCHDHKFDPIPQKDYYRMAAFFCNINRFRNGGPTDEATAFANTQEKTDYEHKVADLDAKKSANAALIKEIETAYRAKRDTLLDARDLTNLRYRYYEGAFDSLPNFDALTPAKSGTLAQSFIDLTKRRRDESFGFVFEGDLNVPREGDYTFYLDSDDGSRLTIAGKRLLDKPGSGGQGMEQHAVVHLVAGRTPFRIDYFQGGGPFGLNFAWSGPNMERRPLSNLASSSDLGLPTLLSAELPQTVGKQKAELYNKLIAAKTELDKQDLPAFKVLCVTEDGTKPSDMFVMKRGDPNSPGDKVEAGFPVCLGGGDAVPTAPATGSKSTGKRTALANWLVSPTNPLTARVIVNRIWQWHFGRGIVRTPSDFGMQGSLPTNPELLDWLTTEFVKDGWSIKKLSRLILTSNAYKQSTRSNPAGLAKDPANDLFWRFDMRRLDAEEIRDSLLAVSGTLNPALYGESIYPEIPKVILAAQSRPGNDWYTEKMTPSDLNRRSIYIHVKRSLLYPMMAAFDLADTDRTSAVRFASTQPTQALSTMNGPFFNQEAHALAARIRSEKIVDGKAFVQRVFTLALQRPATAAETREGLALIARLEAKGATIERAQEYLCLMAFNLNEFMYVD